MTRIGYIIADGQRIPDDVMALADQSSNSDGWGRWIRTPRDTWNWAPTLHDLSAAYWREGGTYTSTMEEPGGNCAPYRVMAVREVCTGGADCELHPEFEGPHSAQGLDAEPAGPLTLTLPEVPAEAVALRGNTTGDRYVLRGEEWSSHQWCGRYHELLYHEPEGVTPEFAPPREPRTWKQIDGAPDDISDVIEVRGQRYRVAVRRQTGQTTFVHLDEHGATGAVTFTLGHLRELGDVTEVLDA